MICLFHLWEDLYEMKDGEPINHYHHCKKCGNWKQEWGASSDDPWWESVRKPNTNLYTLDEARKMYYGK